MFGINTMVRSVATGVAASVDSISRTAVGSLALVEKAVERRLDSDYQEIKGASLKMEALKDVTETAKSCGFSSVEEGVDAYSTLVAKLRK